MQQHRTRSHQVARALKADADAKRTWSEKFADHMTKIFGSVGFLIFNILFFLTWVILNLGVIPGFSAFDPFPFGLLTMIVSLEAIFLAILVLISQNRGEKVDELREEIDLRIDITTEQELTKVLQLQSLLLKKLGIDVSKDRELKQMLEPENTKQLKEDLEKQI